MIDYYEVEVYNLRVRGRNRDAKIDRDWQRKLWYKLNAKKAREEDK